MAYVNLKTFDILEKEDLEERGRSDSFECDECINVELVIYVKQQIHGIYGWFGVKSVKTGEYILVSDSNDLVVDRLQSLPLGKHRIKLSIPKRSIAPGEYFVTVNFQCSSNGWGYFLDRNEEVLKFEVHDYRTKRGDKRAGYFSTLLDWEFLE